MVDQALQLQPESHIEARRYNKKGRLTRVKHVIWGWISPSEEYFLEKLHDPSIAKIIEGGYRLKQSIWGSEVLGVPTAGLIAAFAFGLAVKDRQDGNPLLAALDVAALGLPFGELYFFYRGLHITETVVNKYEEALKDPCATCTSTNPFFLIGPGLSFRLWACIQCAAS